MSSFTESYQSILNILGEHSATSGLRTHECEVTQQQTSLTRHPGPRMSYISLTTSFICDSSPWRLLIRNRAFLQPLISRLLLPPPIHQCILLLSHTSTGDHLTCIEEVESLKFLRTACAMLTMTFPVNEASPPLK